MKKFQSRAAFLGLQAMGAALISAAVVQAPIAFAQPASNDTEIAQAKQLLIEERYIEALAAAQDAKRLDPSDYRASYYISMAHLSMRQFDPAKSEAQIALGLAPDTAKPAVSKLISTIASLETGTSNLSSADEALAEGLFGKAARLYEEAWASGRNAPDYAFKAADLYVTRLKQPVDAARVLRQVQAALPGTLHVDRAEEELRKLQPELRTIAETYVQKSRKQSGDEAFASLQSAEDADPTYREIHVDRMERASWDRSDQTGFENALKGFSRRETPTVDAIKRIRNIHEWLKKPEFVAFMSDLMGRDQVETLRNSWSAAEIHKTLNNLVTNSRMTVSLSSKMDWRNWAYKKSEKWSVSQISNISPCISKVSLKSLLASSSGSSKLTTEYIIDCRKFSLVYGNNVGAFLANDSANDTAVTFSLSVADDRDGILVDLVRYHEFCRPYTAWFGLGYKFAEPAISQKLGLPVNVIEKIEPGGPADKAGLAPGDAIGAINGRSSLDIVGETVKGGVPGTEYKVSFLRGGKWKNTVVQAAARPIY